MGYYTITIKGLGCHHNEDNKVDADKMTFQFAHDLKNAGHEISEALFTYNYSEDDLLKIGGVLNLRNHDLLGKGKPTALTLKEITSIEHNKSFVNGEGDSWTNGNFKKLIDTAKVLHSELILLKNKG